MAVLGRDGPSCWPAIEGIMTWSALIALAAHVVRQHYRLVSVRGDGECVLLDGGVETVEGRGIQ